MENALAYDKNGGHLAGIVRNEVEENDMKISHIDTEIGLDFSAK